MMGERLSNKNVSTSSKNRHSVCLGAGFQVHEPSIESSGNRRSLSPTSEHNLISKKCDKNMSDQLLKMGTNNDEVDISHKKLLTPQSPQKRRNSRSSIPVYIGKTPVVNHTPESPKTTRTRHSMSYKSSNETSRATNSDQQFRSRRSTFPRNSFSSMTSNSSSTSATNDSNLEDRYSRGCNENVILRSPSHKSYHSPNKTLEKTSITSNNNPKTANPNNNLEQTNAPVSPTSKSRIPVLRSSSCRSVPQSVSNAKSTIPRSICFGHGIPRAFNSFRGGQNWYQMLNDKSVNGNKYRSCSIDKYSEQSNMDTSALEKCNFEDMRMALD